MSDPIVFLEGPPFISGKKGNKSSGLHIGHALISYIKSTIMHAMPVKNHWTGTDNHGLPMEMLVMDILGLNTPSDIINYGINKFNKKCQEMVFEYEDRWDPVFDMIGRPYDKQYRYRTSDFSFMESVWWAFNELYKKDLIYLGVKILPYDISSKCILSNFEAGQNYQNINENTAYILFKSSNMMKPLYYVAWTTTPWTLSSNMALCVNPNGNYHYARIKYKDTRVKDINDIYIDMIIVFEENYINNIKKFTNVDIIKTVKGHQLINKMYFNTECQRRKIIADDFVELNDKQPGTGIVHIAPAFGEIDYEVAIKNNIITKDFDLLDACKIDDSGNYKDGIWKGMNIFDSNKLIIKYLKDHNLILGMQQINHPYPYSPRTHKPLIYKVCSSYFVNVEKIKDDMIRLCNTTIWNSNSAKNRFMKWLENAKDWCISRNRFYGTPIPVWKSKSDKIIVIGSVSELEEFIKDNIKSQYTSNELTDDTVTDLNNQIPIVTKQENGNVTISNIFDRTVDIDNVKLTNIHPEFIKNIVIHKDNEDYFWIDNVFDCWFESGSVPFAQYHYPFENEHVYDNVEYLSDFVCEGIDQTRGWFYTLLVLSTALFNKAPYKNVICTGLVLDKNKKKFSKSSGNFITIEEIIKKYNSDSLRMYLLNSSALIGEPFVFLEHEIKNINAKLIQLNNSVSYYSEYYKYFNELTKDMTDKEKDDITCEFNIFDKWIMNKVLELKETINANIVKYEFRKNIPLIFDFIELLTNWYIKFNRKRFNGSKDLHNMKAALETYKFCMFTFINVCNPFMLFTCNKIKIAIDDDKPILNYVNTNDNINDIIDMFKNIIINIRQYRNTTKSHTSIKKAINKIIISYNNDNNIIEIIKNKLYHELINEVNTLGLIFIVDNAIKYECGYNITYDLSETQETIESDQLRLVICNVQQLRGKRGLHVYDTIKIVYKCNEYYYKLLTTHINYLKKKLKTNNIEIKCDTMQSDEYVVETLEKV